MSELLWSGSRRSGALPALAMLIIVVALNAWLQPKFFGYASLDDNIATFAPTILVCVAQALFVLNRELDLSVGAGVSLVNCVLASAPVAALGPFWSIGVGLAVALLMGAVNGAVVGYLGLSSLIATFATGAVWFGAALALMPQPGGALSPAIGNFYAASVAGVPVPLIIVVLAMAGVSALLWHRLGRRVVAVGSDPAAAYRAGIDIPRVKLLTYMYGWILVFLSALAISAQTLSGDADVGQTYTLTSIAAVVIGGISLGGGRGTSWGALLGALVLGFIANVIYFAGIPSSWQEFFKGVVIVIALGFMVFGQKTPR
ncbi:MAG: ABC transporter permease [Acetobacteraceae bacterium]